MLFPGLRENTPTVVRVETAGVGTANPAEGESYRNIFSAPGWNVVVTIGTKRRRRSNVAILGTLSSYFRDVKSQGNPLQYYPMRFSIIEVQVASFSVFGV